MSIERYDPSRDDTPGRGQMPGEESWKRKVRAGQALSTEERLERLETFMARAIHLIPGWPIGPEEPGGFYQLRDEGERGAAD